MHYLGLQRDRAHNPGDQALSSCSAKDAAIEESIENLSSLKARGKQRTRRSASELKISKMQPKIQTFLSPEDGHRTLEAKVVGEDLLSRPLDKNEKLLKSEAAAKEREGTFWETDVLLVAKPHRQSQESLVLATKEKHANGHVVERDPSRSSAILSFKHLSQTENAGLSGLNRGYHAADAAKTSPSHRRSEATDWNQQYASSNYIGSIRHFGAVSTSNGHVRLEEDQFLSRRSADWLLWAKLHAEKKTTSKQKGELSTEGVGEWQWGARSLQTMTPDIKTLSQHKGGPW